MSYKEDTKYFNGVSKQKIKCQNCGHVIIFYSGNPKVPCSHCGHMVYKNKREEFKDKMKSKILRAGR